MRAAIFALSLVACGPRFTDREDTPTAVRHARCSDVHAQACRAEWFDEVLSCSDGYWRSIRRCAPLRCALDTASGQFGCTEWR